MLSRALLFLAATSIFSRVSAQYEPPCEPGESDDDTLQCVVCGAPNSSGIDCAAYNATFDDLKITLPVGTYNNAVWTGVTTGVRGAANPIIPASKHHFARALDGTAVLSFNDITSGTNENADLGRLVSFDYACASPVPCVKPCVKSVSDVAVACTIIVIASALAVGESDDVEDPALIYNNTLSYTPDVPRYASMESGSFSYDFTTPYDETVPGFLNYNFTFEAIMANGNPAVLYLDNVVYATYSGSGI